jgi:uncharacterized OB-fold protein
MPDTYPDAKSEETLGGFITPRGHDVYTGNCTNWIVPPDEGTIHAYAVCHFGSDEFLPQHPSILILVEFEGDNTLFRSRLAGVESENASLEWIGMKVKARFLRNAKLKPTEVYSVPAE